MVRAATALPVAHRRRMPPQADKLMAENVSKNLIDEDEVRSLLRATALIAVVPGHGRHAPPVTLTASLNGC